LRRARGLPTLRRMPALVQVASVDDLRALAASGRRIGPSPWREITQAMVDAFAELGGDRQWIHTDPARAKRESAYGGTIAHGNLTLAMLDGFRPDLLERVGGFSVALNYGWNKVRFPAPLPVGATLGTGCAPPSTRVSALPSSSNPDAIASAKQAHRGMVWDGRFRLIATPPPGCEVSAWGADAVKDREFLPMIVAAGLPVLRSGGGVLTNDPAMMHEFLFCPPRPAASAPFFPLPMGA